MEFTIKFLNRLVQVKKFQVIDNKLYILFNDKLSIIDQTNETILNFNSDTLSIVNDTLFSDENFYYDTKTKKIETINQLNDYYFTGIHFNNNLVFTNKDVRIYSLKRNTTIKNIPFFEDRSLLLLFEDKFLALGNDFYALYDLKSLNIIWQRSFSELLQGHEIRQFGKIIFYENKLFAYLADKKDPSNLATVSIDINTGNILGIYKGFAGNLMLSNRKFYVASFEMVKILDHIVNKIIEIDFTDILKPLGLRIHWNASVVEGDCLYFVDGHSHTSNKFGVLDLRSRKLIWNTEIKIEDDINNNIQEIKVLDNKLYVHCSDNSMHVFELRN